MATEQEAAQGPPRPKGNVRWIICGLLFLAVVLSYIDRLVIGVLKPTPRWCSRRSMGSASCSSDG